MQLTRALVRRDSHTTKYDTSIKSQLAPSSASPRWGESGRVEHRLVPFLIHEPAKPERDSSLLTTYLCESTLSSRLFGGLASRHGSLNSLFREAIYLPFWTNLPNHAVVFLQRERERERERGSKRARGVVVEWHPTALRRSAATRSNRKEQGLSTRWNTDPA